MLAEMNVGQGTPPGQEHGTRIWSGTDTYHYQLDGNWNLTKPTGRFSLLDINISF